MIKASIPIVTMTHQFSFNLAPSPIHGVGVFASHFIKKGMQLHLWNKRDDSVFVDLNDVKGVLMSNFVKRYCAIDREEGGYWCPKQFNRMSVGWYLNHSSDPNAGHDEGYRYFALRSIKKNEEITIDYRSLGE